MASKIGSSEHRSKMRSIQYRLLCLLEEFNDQLYEGDLDEETYLDQIKYQCERVTDIME